MSDPDENQDGSRPDETLAEAFEYCAHCDAELPKEGWCPTITDRDDEGNLTVRSFCDEACKDAWTGEDRAADHDQ